MSFVKNIKENGVKGFLPFLLSNIVPLIALVIMSITFLSVTLYQNKIINENTRQQIMQRIDEILLELKEYDNIILSVVNEDMIVERITPAHYWKENRFEELRNTFDELGVSAKYIDDCFVYMQSADSVMSKHGLHTSEEFFEMIFSKRGVDKEFFYTLINDNDKSVVNTLDKSKDVYFKTSYDDIKVFYVIDSKKLCPETIEYLKGEKLNIYIFNTKNQLSFSLNSDKERIIESLSDITEENSDIYVYSTQIFNSLYKICISIKKGLFDYLLIFLISVVCVILLANLYFSFWSLRRLANKNYMPMVNINRLLSAKQINYEYNLIEESVKSLIASNDMLKEETLAHEKQMKEFLLYQLLQNEFSEKLGFLLKKYGIDFKYDNFYVVAFSPRGVLKASENEEKFYSFLLEEVNDVFSKEIIYCLNYDNSMILVVNCHSFDEQKQYENITKLSYRLNLMKSSVLFDVIIGVSDIHKGCANINVAFMEALQSAYRDTDSIEPIQIYRYSDVKENTEIFDLNFEKNMYEFIISQNYEEAETEIENIFKKVVSRSKRRKNETFFRVTLALIRVVGKVEPEGKRIDDLFNALMVYFLEYDAETYKNKLCAIVQSLVEHQSEIGKQDFSNEIINAAVQYIHSNYSDCNMSLTSICSYLGYSMSYISTMFKKTKGIGLMDYLQNYRVECAKKMILEGMQIAQVCEKCGFSSLRSFTRIFKKVTGKTATEYKVQEKATEWNE